uniref:Uncharacterized protein n=1 Tax=Panagrolaimus superbus TaxID=310955 RepID=A0A914ZC85_9BILA
MRIIIFDKNDKNQVHEYRNGGKKLLCLGCHAKNGKYIWASRSDDTENPIISIPPPEEHVCESRSLKEVREQQRTFKKKGQKRGRNDNDISESEVEGPREIKRTRKSAQIATEKLTNCFKDCDNISTEKDESDNEESENSKKPRRKSAIVIE